MQQAFDKNNWKKIAILILLILKKSSRTIRAVTNTWKLYPKGREEIKNLRFRCFDEILENYTAKLLSVSFRQRLAFK